MVHLCEADKRILKSKLERFYRYKYSGPIVFVPIILLIAVPWIILTDESEFFDRWSCTTLDNYKSDLDVPDKFPKYSELTDEQLNRINGFLDECKFVGK